MKQKQFDVLDMDDHDDHVQGASEYNWEKDSSLMLASESTVGERMDTGGMRFGGTMFTGEDEGVDPSLVYRRGLSRAVVVGFDWGASMMQNEPGETESSFFFLVLFISSSARSPEMQFCC
jgi:hypothetical protein